jgi:predicted RNA-binding Zn-ribbon protein involved in translation (DUF1610 family)
MTTIRTTCPRCGEVDMSPEAILLEVGPDGEDGSYRFVCPRCREQVVKPADRKIVALLVSAGVGVGDNVPSAGPEEDDGEGPTWLERHAGGPPFTVDDLISFHFLLQDDRRLQRFLADR